MDYLPILFHIHDRPALVRRFDKRLVQAADVAFFIVCVLALAEEEKIEDEEAPSLLGALRHCFFKADKSKVVNCVSASAQKTKAGFVVNTIFLRWN